MKATVEAFKLTTTQCWEHKIARPTATEWKGRYSAKTSSLDRLTSSHTTLNNCTSLLAVTCPCKNQAGWPFWCSYRNADFSAYNHAQDKQLQKSTGHYWVWRKKKQGQLLAFSRVIMFCFIPLLNGQEDLKLEVFSQMKVKEWQCGIL